MRLDRCGAAIRFFCFARRWGVVTGQRGLTRETQIQNFDNERACETNLRRIISAIPALAWSATADGITEFVNQHYVDYTGLSLDRLHEWLELGVHPEDFPGLAQSWQTVRTSGQPGEAKARLRRHDGQYRWFQFRANPLHDESGKIVKWYGINTDIEGYTRADDPLAASQRNLKLIIDTMPALAWTAGADGRAEYGSQSYLDYVGLSLEQMQGWGWTVAVHPDDLAGLASAWHAIMAAGNPGEAEARLRRHDGEYRMFLFRVSPIRDEAGNIVRWYGVNTDIEDHKRAEQELRRSEAFLAKGQELSLTGSFSWNPATTEYTWSEQLYRIFGFEPGVPITLDLIGTRYHPEDRPVLDDMAARRCGGATDFDYEHRLLMPDGSIKHVRVVAQAGRDEDGCPPEYFGAVQDITQRRLAEQALDKVRSELTHVARTMSLSALTASIAHEVNQPLAGIITNASTCMRVLAADPPNINVARETARRTIRDANRAADVVTRLRALFSKKTAPKEIVDLNLAAREVLSLAFGDLLRNRIILRTTIDDARPLTVSADRVQLQQVILNLVRNASDAMSAVNDRPRHLTIATGATSDAARLTVTDAGPGFAPHDAEQLFDAFYTTKSDGMGIGLFVSRSIIEGLGGRLWAETNDGPGATFAFSIPRQQATAAGERWDSSIR